MLKKHTHTHIENHKVVYWHKKQLPLDKILWKSLKMLLKCTKLLFSEGADISFRR